MAAIAIQIGACTIAILITLWAIDDKLDKIIKLLEAENGEDLPR